VTGLVKPRSLDNDVIKQALDLRRDATKFSDIGFTDIDFEFNIING